MLVLSRKTAEELHIGSQIVLTVLGIKGNRVQLGVSAPREFSIRRAELESRMKSVDVTLQEPHLAIRRPR